MNQGSSVDTYSPEYMKQCLERYRENRAELLRIYREFRVRRISRAQVEAFTGSLSDMDQRTFRKLWADWKSGKIVD